MGQCTASRRASPVAQVLIACGRMDPAGLGRRRVRRDRSSTRGTARCRGRGAAPSASRSVPPTSPTRGHALASRPSAASRAREAATSRQPPSPRPSAPVFRTSTPEPVRRPAHPGGRMSPPTASSTSPRSTEGLPSGMTIDAAIEHADQAEPRPDGLPHGDPDGRGRHPHGQPPRQPDLLRRHPAHPLRPLLVPAARRPAAERRQHQLSARRHASSGAHAPVSTGSPGGSPRPSSRTPSATRSTTSTRSTSTPSPRP